MTNLPQLQPGDIVLMDSASSQSASWFGRQVTKAIKWRTRKIGEEPTRYAHAAMVSKPCGFVKVPDTEYREYIDGPVILEMTQPRGRETAMQRDEIKGTKIAVYRCKHFHEPIEKGTVFNGHIAWDAETKTSTIWDSRNAGPIESYIMSGEKPPEPQGVFSLKRRYSELTIDVVSDIVSGQYVVDRMREICIKPNKQGRKYGYVKIGGFWLDGALTNVKQLFKRNGDVRLFTKLTKAHVCSTAVAAAYESVGIKCHPYSSPWQANPDDIDDYCRESDDFELIYEDVI